MGETKFNDVMIDLETVGQRPGCGILSIGAVAFDPKSGQLGPELYVVVSRESCRQAGLHEDPSTLEWWEKQSDQAREVLSHIEEAGLPLVEALTRLNDYLAQFGGRYVRVWGNGSDFDQPILISAYAAVGTTAEWKFWNNRCYRTLKNLIKGPPLKREGTYHNALDDAKTQALHAMDLLGALNG